MLLRSPNFPTTSQSALKWAYVRRRFLALQSNLAISDNALIDGKRKVIGVVSSLNRHYRGQNSDGWVTIVGSWRKRTAISPSSDIDLLYHPPIELFFRYECRAGNRQSQLIQDLRNALATTYPQTRIRGDGQVVVISFNTIDIEVVPGFSSANGGYIICDTNNGGTWKRIEPDQEFAAFDLADSLQSGNVRKLTRIFKQWKRHCNVPIKSFHIEQLIKEAVSTSQYGFNDEYWFDWLVRDTFEHMLERVGQGFFMPGTTLEWINFGSLWQSKALSAYKNSIEACAHERFNNNVAAGVAWQKIFGRAIPHVI